MSELEPGAPDRDHADTVIETIDDASFTPAGFDLAVARAELADLRRRYEGCLAVNREQVGRLARTSVELETLRAKCDAQTRALALTQDRIVALESKAPKP